MGKKCILVASLLALFSLPARGQMLGRQADTDQRGPLFFKDNYLTFELVKNHPFADSQREFSSGNNSVFVGFRHILRDKWLMGVHGGFKKFYLRSESRELSIFTILQESQTMFRLSHPVYLSLGPKLMYLLPTKGNKIPPEREKQFTREVGLGLSVSMLYAVSKHAILNIRLDRWRGVNRELFQGTETAVGLNVALP